MPSISNQIAMRESGQIMPRTGAGPGSAPTLKEIAYDHVVAFTLSGVAGTRVPGVINISTDGAFVAVAIGYGFVPKNFPSFSWDVVASVRQQFWKNQLKANLSQVRAAFTGGTLGDALGNLLPPDVRKSLLKCLLRKMCGIDFKYTIVDSGTGRELSNLPVLAVAGLGKSDGERPFRPMATPMLFMPRSTIRFEVEEISEGPLYVGAELQIVLQGYKILGYGAD